RSPSSLSSFFFFFHDPPTTEIYTLSLHDALPISRCGDRPGGIDGQAHARADDRDVHLGARDEAQVRITRAGRARRQQEGHDDLALAEREPARSEHDVLDGDVARPLRPRHRGDGARGDERGHAVSRWRAVAEVAT